MPRSSGFNGWNKKTLGGLGAIIALLLLWKLLGPIPTALLFIAALAISLVKWYNSETEDTDDGGNSDDEDSNKKSNSTEKPATASKAGTGLARALGLTEDETDEFVTAYQQLLSNPKPMILFCQTLSPEQMDVLVVHFDKLFGRLGLRVDYRSSGHRPAAPTTHYPQQSAPVRPAAPRQTAHDSDHTRVEPAIQPPTADNEGLDILTPRDNDQDYYTDGGDQTGHFPALPPRDTRPSGEFYGDEPEPTTGSGTPSQFTGPTGAHGRWSGTVTMGGSSFHMPGFEGRQSSDDS